MWLIVNRYVTIFRRRFRHRLGNRGQTPGGLERAVVLAGEGRHLAAVGIGAGTLFPNLSGAAR